jgi:hypothetical protein
LILNFKAQIDHVFVVFGPRCQMIIQHGIYGRLVCVVLAQFSCFPLARAIQNELNASLSELETLKMLPNPEMSNTS